MPFNRAARMSSLNHSMLRSAQAASADSRASSSRAEAPALAPSAALMSGQASTASALHDTRSKTTHVESEIGAARPSAYSAALGLLKRSGSLRRTPPAPRRLPPRTPHTSRKPGTGKLILANALKHGVAALELEDAGAPACMQDAGMHGNANASSSDQLCNRTAWDNSTGQHAVEDVDGGAANLAEPDANLVEIAAHSSPATTEGVDEISGTPSGTSTPLSNSRGTEDSISTEGGGPAEPAKPLQAMPSLGAALARFTRMSQSRADPNPEAAALQEALPLASAIARLTRASLERVRQLRRTASDGQGRSGNLESVAGNAVNAEAEIADAGQDSSTALLLGGELLVTVVDAQVAISLSLLKTGPSQHLPFALAARRSSLHVS